MSESRIGPAAWTAAVDHCFSILPYDEVWLSGAVHPHWLLGKAPRRRRGGFAPDLEHNRAALDLIVKAICAVSIELQCDRVDGQRYVRTRVNPALPIACCRVLCAATHRGVIT